PKLSPELPKLDTVGKPSVWDYNAAEKFRNRSLWFKQFREHERFQEFVAVGLAVATCSIVFLCAWLAKPSDIQVSGDTIVWNAGEGTGGAAPSESPPANPAVSVSVATSAKTPYESNKYFGCELVAEDQFERCVERRLGRDILWRNLQFTDPA